MQKIANLSIEGSNPSETFIKLDLLMIKEKKILILTTIHQKNFNNFLEKILLSFKKYKLDLKYITKKNEKSKRFTILRSPHVNKSARDQIELKHFKYYFSLKKKVVFNFFLSLFNKFNQYSFKFEYKLIKNQKILYLNL
tara:strand:- start:451 stop:867 length:417 start_codon:yes stop_codon:yes gene_type:complete